MIEMKGLTKYFGKKLAVDSLTYSIEQGEVFGLLGPNGAGKTTTIRMMIGLLKPNTGEIYIDGDNVWENRRKVHEKIGVVFELPNLYMKSSIKKNLKMFGDIYGLDKYRIYEVMEELQLLDKANTKVEKLSKGWKQRVIIARAVLHQPKVLFLDEPTSGLDPNTQELIRKYIRRLNENGTTIIITTHDMKEATKLCTSVGFIYNGRLVEAGEPEALMNKYKEEDIEDIDLDTIFKYVTRGELS